jgi:hypothetical protein
MPFSLGFLCNRYSATWRSGPPDLSNGQNGHNFQSDHWIALKCLHEFPEAVRVKIAITFDPTIRSHSNFCESFRRPFSLGLIWNPNSGTRRSGSLNLSKGLK